MTKTQEVTARQLLGWITRNLARIVYHPGDKSVSVYGGRGSAHARSDDPAAVLEAIKVCRSRDIRERAADRRDKRDGVWPWNVDAHGRLLRQAAGVPDATTQEVENG